jgi:hypothetical protein
MCWHEALLTRHPTTAVPLPAPQLDTALGLLANYKNTNEPYSNLVLLYPPGGRGSANSLMHTRQQYGPLPQLLWRLRDKAWAADVVVKHLQAVLDPWVALLGPCLCCRAAAPGVVLRHRVAVLT